jgi:monofunctional chorismate mutase
MNELEEARQGIAEVDKEIASLFERRMRLAGKVLDYKKGNGLPILDAAQEERVIARNAGNIADPAIQEYYVLFLRDLMKLSKAYQIPPGKEKEVLPGFHPHSADAAEYRSKSEEIIALVLQSNGYRFMYECEIVANQRVYKPDFTIMDPRTNQLVYFEHFGRPDQPGYYEKMVRKLIDYWYEGIRIGKNLIVTFETEKEPLTTAQVQMALDQFFGTISK